MLRSELLKFKNTFGLYLILSFAVLEIITIPMYSNLVYSITNALEEKEREEFTRLKVIKRMKEKKASG